MAPESSCSQSCSNFQRLYCTSFLLPGKVDGAIAHSNKRSVIYCLVEALLEPLELIGSVIIHSDLCMLYAIMLCTELDIIFHLFDCINSRGTYCNAGEMAGRKKGQCGAPISVYSSEREREGSASVFGWTLGLVSLVSQLDTDLQTTDGLHQKIDFSLSSPVFFFFQNKAPAHLMKARLLKTASTKRS